VIGGASCSDEVAEAAETVGREIAARGAILICGGLTGVMTAACRGAKSAGGLTIGVLPGREAQAANPYVDVPIPTGMGLSRNSIIAASGDAVIAIDGSVGTLSELAYSLMRDVPVVGLDTWELDETRFPAGRKVLRAATPEDAVRMAFDGIR